MLTQIYNYFAEFTMVVTLSVFLSTC